MRGSRTVSHSSGSSSVEVVETDEEAEGTDVEEEEEEEVVEEEVVVVLWLGRRIPETSVPLMLVNKVVLTSIPVGCFGGAVGTLANPIRMG